MTAGLHRYDRRSMLIRGGGDPSYALASKPSGEWACRLGASPPKRMSASWFGSCEDPTEYKVAARRIAPHGGLHSAQGTSREKNQMGP